MTRTLCSLAGMAFLLTATARTAAEATAQAQPKDTAELVRRLGDASFQVREEASAQLLKLGLAAKQFLLDGAHDPDLEIRRRCEELLPAVLQADLEARIAAFLADRDGKHEHDLPGWKRFRKLVGADPAARELFADIQKSEAGRFLAQCDARPDAAGTMLQSRALMLQQRLYNPQLGHQPVSLAEVATLLFIASDERVQVPLQAVYILNNFFHQPTIRSAITAPAGSSPFKRILVAWMNGQTDPNVVQQIFWLAMNLELKEVLGLALRVAQDKTVKGHPLGLALVTIGKLGGKEHMKIFEAHLGDATLIGNLNLNNVRGTTELRDVALAMLVHVTGQSHEDYGFAFVRSNARANMAWKFNPFSLGFSTPEQRQLALKRWQAHVAAQKK